MLVVYNIAIRYFDTVAFPTTKIASPFLYVSSCKLPNYNNGSDLCITIYSKL